jgi:hypothetical protein
MKLKELFEAKAERSILSVMGKQIDPYPGPFSCYYRNMTSLEGAPSVVNGYFSCADNKLTSLQGAPSIVKGYFVCINNNLTSLEGAPSVVKNSFVCSNNKLKSLAGIHKIIKEIHGFADFNGNPIKSDVLGLMRIKGLMKVYLDNKQVQNILNKYLAGDRDIIRCQSELQDAGLEEFAKL